MMTLKYRSDLPSFMRELKLPMVAVEVGCAEMLFTNDLLTNGIEKLYCVDIWKCENVRGDGSNPDEWHDRNFTSGMDRIRHHGSKAVILKGFSEAMSMKVADNHLGLVYLDAGHSYEDVLLDLTVWLPKLVKGGIMAGHDYINRSYGVYEAVQEFTKGRYKVQVIRENKDEDAGFFFIK